MAVVSYDYQPRPAMDLSGIQQKNYENKLAQQQALFNGISQLADAINKERMKKEAAKKMQEYELSGMNRTAKFNPLSGSYEVQYETPDINKTIKEWKPQTKEEALAFEKEKQAIRSSGKKEYGSYQLKSDMVDKISNQQSTFDTMNMMANDLTANVDKYSKFMGPGKSVLRNPLMTYADKDYKDFAAWKSGVQDSFQKFRKEITGAQASVQELRLLSENRPTENDTPEVFINKTKRLNLIAAKVQKRYLDNIGKAKYDISGYQEQIDNLDNTIEQLSGELETKKGGKLSSGISYTVE